MMCWIYDEILNSWRYVGRNGEVFGRIERKGKAFYWAVYSIPFCDGFMENLATAQCIVERIVASGAGRGF